MPDPYDLERFVAAQAPVMPGVLRELRAGRKTSHWMWFVFPQLAGLGLSPMAHHYAIGTMEEARAYLAHPLLGERLRQCAQLALEAPASRDARTVFGSPDDLKFCSSMTLFSRADPGEPLFSACLDRYFNGVPDPRTLRLL